MKEENQDRINRILHHKKFLEYVSKNEKAEKERIFCKHGIEHFLDVARIAYIKALEQQLPLKKDVIYGTALLHDIGKHRQYEEKIPHELASAELAHQILLECGYEEEEYNLMEEAIKSHRTKPSLQSHELERILYEADKQSRLCYFCKAQSGCNWSDEKKNLFIKY